MFCDASRHTTDAESEMYQRKRKPVTPSAEETACTACTWGGDHLTVPVLQWRCKRSFFLHSEHLEHHLSDAVDRLCSSFLADFYPLTPLLCLRMTNILTAESHSGGGQGHPFNPITSQIGGMRKEIKCCFYPVCGCVCAPWHFFHRVTLRLCVWMCVVMLD